MLDLDTCLDLLTAVAMRWALDARRDPGELAALSEWVDLPRCEVERRLVKRETLFRPARPGERACPFCGASMTHRATQARFCSERCRIKAGQQRRKGAYVTE